MEQIYDSLPVAGEKRALFPLGYNVIFRVTLFQINLSHIKSSEMKSRFIDDDELRISSFASARVCYLLLWFSTVLRLHTQLDPCMVDN